MEKRKVLVLGIDGMDQRTTKRLLDEGRLPNVKKFLEQGSARENLSMLGAIPTITPPCWTTLGTGTYPGTHGITCYWRQSPDSLDAVTYNLDSRLCKAEQMWKVTAESGLKTLVWHWPGSSWPPSSDSELLHVIDGTQTGSVNMGIAQMDWEKILHASKDTEKATYLPRVEKPVGAGFKIDSLEDIISHDDDEMMELWWGDEARKGKEIRTYVHGLEDSEILVGARVAYDLVLSPITKENGWNHPIPDGLEFTVLTSGGKVMRYGRILRKNGNIYNRVEIYKSKEDEKPLVSLSPGELSSGVLDIEIKNGEEKLCNRMYKLLSLEEDGSDLRLWISNALDVNNDVLWSPKRLLKEVSENVAPVPPVSLIGGEDAELARDVFLPSWSKFNEWQADSIKKLIELEQYDVVFSHLHNIDCAGHQFWHLAKNLEPWKHTNPKFYQNLIEEIYEQTDKYLGNFLPFLEEGWTVFIVSDHGLVVGENVPPDIGEYGGLNVGVMKELGYTVLKKDENGKEIDEVDWEKTRAVQIRSNYIYINLKGRDAHGIVEPEEKYELEDQIINDLYAYRHPSTKKRVIGIALRNKDCPVIGLGGEECGDIFFTIEEGYNHLHGDGLSTAYGYYGTSVTPVFLAAGPGIKKNFTTDRIIRQVDVVPTIAAVLGTRVTKQCEGAPIYQILS